MEVAGGDHHHQGEIITGCKDQHNNNFIMKGKRTKRLRPQSPIPFAIPKTSSSPEDGGRGGGDDGGGDNNDYVIKSTNNLSPTTSAEFQDSTTEEEEDMANCLILLAQGQSRGASSSPNHHQPHNDHNTSSRRFLEPTKVVVGPTPGTEKASTAAVAGGYYVYECKTCNRTFPSFQALGGHRASHKKPKENIGDYHKSKHFGIGLLPSYEDTQLFKNNVLHNNNNNNTSSSPLSLHLSNKGMVLSNNKSSPKVHECSICGAEFTSGQALGGHMRRHRAPIGANTTLSLTAPSVPAFEPQQQRQLQLQLQLQQPIKKQRMLSLNLDLNVPAPSEDDHHREPKFVLASKQQQQQQERLRAQILVDCHY